MAPISCQKDKYEGRKIGKGEKKKARSETHLIKADHGVTKRKEPMTILPQFLSIISIKTLIQPLDEKTKMKTKREFPKTVRDVRKSTHLIDTQIDFEKLLFAAGMLRIRHEALLRNRLVALNSHSPLPFALKALFCRLLSLVRLGGKLERLRRGSNILMESMAMTGNGGKQTWPIKKKGCGSSRGRNRGRRRSQGLPA